MNYARWLLLIFLAALLAALAVFALRGPATSPTQANVTKDSAETALFPQQRAIDGYTLTIYAPQVRTWTAFERFTSTIAFALTPAGESVPQLRNGNGCRGYRRRHGQTHRHDSIAPGDGRDVCEPGSGRIHRCRDGRGDAQIARRSTRSVPRVPRRRSAASPVTRRLQHGPTADPRALDRDGAAVHRRHARDAGGAEHRPRTRRERQLAAAAASRGRQPVLLACTRPMAHVGQVGVRMEGCHIATCGSGEPAGDG